VIDVRTRVADLSALVFVRNVTRLILIGRPFLDDSFVIIKKQRQQLFTGAERSGSQ
jgi:hypothetical protein